MYRKNIIGIIAAVFSLSTFSNPLLASSTQTITKRPFRETPLYKHIIDKTEKDLADFYTKEKSSESKKQQTQEKTKQEQPQKKKDIILTDKVYRPTEPTPKLSYGLDFVNSLKLRKRRIQRSFVSNIFPPPKTGQRYLLHHQLKLLYFYK